MKGAAQGLAPPEQKRGSRRPKDGSRGDASDEMSTQPSTAVPKIVRENDHAGGGAGHERLSAAELEQVHEMVLRAENPHAPKNLVFFHLREQVFQEIPTTDHVQVHFHMETKLYHKSSDEAKRQKMTRGEDGAEDSGRPARNEFNYSERASQTINNPTRDRETNTEPPPRRKFAALATQWEIYDSFVADQERMRVAKERTKGKGGKEDERRQSTSALGISEAVHHAGEMYMSPRMLASLRITERMVNLNTFHDRAFDYKYLEYALDRQPQNALNGSLMPLWEFISYTWDSVPPKPNKRHVTALSWNAEYTDLFAVGYGSYDFGKRRSGRVCCFSLKNPSFPDYQFATDAGVMCLDWHKQHSSLLAVGLYDGTVLVFDVKAASPLPLYQSTTRTGKHTDPVWQVQWQEDDLSKKHNFLSISSDGRVTSWTLGKSELQYTDIIKLQLVDNIKGGDAEDQRQMFGLAGGLCFDFNRVSEHVFLVGTEEGKIHKCSRAYSSQYLETYEGHTMAVYQVRWNHYHPRIFASCSADWTVKIWDHNVRTALMSFDLNNSVGDIAWAPYSSTVFAACNADGKVFVFDLNVNKHEAMCEQKVGKKIRLNHVAFNPDPTNFTILVGDDHGTVRSFRLSPNLRQITKVEPTKPTMGLGAVTSDDPNIKKEKPKTFEELEIEKLDAIFVMQDPSAAV